VNCTVSVCQLIPVTLLHCILPARHADVERCEFVVIFYHAQYCYSKSSVCPSVHRSLMLMCHVCISWVSFSNYTVNWLKVFTPQSPNTGNLVQMKHPKILVGIGMGSLFSAENLQYLWNVKIGPRSLLTIIGSCIRVFNWYQKMTLNGHYALHCTKHNVFRCPPWKFEWR